MGVLSQCLEFLIGCELPTILETAEIKPDCVRLVEGCRLTLKACECIVVKPGGGTGQYKSSQINFIGMK